jgi:hypothetical protein
LLGLEPVAIPPHVFALDASAITYGCFLRANSELELREFHRVALAPDSFGEGLVGSTLQEERSLRESMDELLSRLGTPVTEATMVLPDAWLRIAFAESADLPRSMAEREEVLRWKLKRLVPFRVDDLRLESMEVEALTNQNEPRRLMFGFAAEALIGHIEAMFSSYGIRLGLVSNVSLSLTQAVEERFGSARLTAVVSVDKEGYALAFTQHGSPVLHRYKTDASKALRELKLTAAFLADRFPSARMDAVHLFAPADLEARWTGWLEEGLGVEVHLASELAEWTQGEPSDDMRGSLPLLGAACTRV